MYTPKGWERGILLEIDSIKKGKPFSNGDIDMFEGGGGAMLELLRKGGVEVTTLDYTFEYQGEVIVPKHSKGRIVFIPD